MRRVLKAPGLPPTPSRAPRSADVDLEGAWRLHPQVALRPERFGALAYHFGTRRLSFLQSRALLDLVCALDGHTTISQALDAAQISEVERPSYERALATLARTGMIVCEADQ